MEDDRRTITVPVIGGLRSKENTRRVQRHLTAGRAQILNMTLRSGGAGCSSRSATRCARRPPHQRWLIRRCAPESTWEFGPWPPSPRSTPPPVSRPSSNSQSGPAQGDTCRPPARGRELSRRIPGSHGHRAAKAKLSRLDRRCVHLRREATHQLTTELAGSYGHLVIEDLDLAAMKRGMGRRAFRRSVSDAAMGLVKPQLAYKTARYGAVLTVADRWFASSQIHHGCTTPDGTPCRLIGKGHIDKKLVCPHTGEVVDRDRNAALNLRDWPDHASCGPVGTTAPSVPGPTEPSVGTGHGADAGSSGAGGAPRSPHPAEAGSGEAKTQTPQGEAA